MKKATADAGKKAAAPVRKASARKAGGEAAPAKRATRTSAGLPRVRTPPSTVAEAAEQQGPTGKAPRKPLTRRVGATPASGAGTEPVASSRFSGSRLAAEQTFDDDDDDWAAPAPSAPASDPSARARAILRSAAAELRAREGVAASSPSTVHETEAVPPAEPAEPTAETLIAPGRRRLAPRRAPAPPAVTPPKPTASPPRTQKPEPEPEPEREPEWTAEDQPLDEEPHVDRIPDAMDALFIPDADAPSTPPASTRRFGSRLSRSAAPPAPAPEPPAPEPPGPETPPPPPPPPAATDAPPAWTPPATAPAKDRKAGGAGLPVLAILLSLLVPVIGAVLGLVLATRARRRGAPLSGLARVVAVIGLVGWLAAGAVALVAARDQGIDYSKLKVGDCFNSSATNEVRGIDVEPCSKPHNSEVFFIVTHPAGPADPYPGKDALVQFAADACLGQPLTDYLGVPLERSTLKDFEIVPQEAAWKEGRRVLVCGIDTGGQGRITGSVKGTSR